MRRFLALLAAVAMVVGAFVVRDRVIEGDDAGGGGGGGGGLVGGSGGGEDGEPLRLVCAAELAEVCEGLDDAEVVVEEAGATVDRLATADGDPGLDAWLVPAPWPGIADVARGAEGRRPAFGEEVRPVARTRLATFGPEDEVQACPWRCVGDAAVDETLRIGTPPPSSAVGLLVYAALTAGYFSDRPSIATNDFDPAFEDWITSASALATTADRPALQRARAGAFFDVALTTEQEVGALLETAAPERVAGLSAAYPEPVATVDIVLAGDGEPVAGELVERLGEAGWSTDGVTGANGLPVAGVLFELRELLGAT